MDWYIEGREGEHRLFGQAVDYVERREEDVGGFLSRYKNYDRMNLPHAIVFIPDHGSDPDLWKKATGLDSSILDEFLLRHVKGDEEGIFYASEIIDREKGWYRNFWVYLGYQAEERGWGKEGITRVLRNASRHEGVHGASFADFDNLMKDILGISIYNYFFEGWPNFLAEENDFIERDVNINFEEFLAQMTSGEKLRNFIYVAGARFFRSLDLLLFRDGCNDFNERYVKIMGESILSALEIRNLGDFNTMSESEKLHLVTEYLIDRLGLDIEQVSEVFDNIKNYDGICRFPFEILFNNQN